MLRQEFATTSLTRATWEQLRSARDAKKIKEIDVDDAELIGPRVLEDPEDVAAFLLVVLAWRRGLRRIERPIRRA